jgi:hypothetical protein
MSDETDAKQPDGEQASNPLIQFDTVSADVVRLAAQRKQDDGAGFAQALMKLVLDARDQGYKIGFASGYAKGRNEVWGKPPNEEAPKPLVKKRKEKVFLSLYQCKEIGERWAAEAAANGGIIPRGLLAELARAYNVSASYIARVTAAYKPEGLDSSAQRSTGMLNGGHAR